jgi:hypothetical protein
MSKRLFLIGCNYYNTEYELRGCINDADSIEAKYRQYGFLDVTRYVETPDHSSKTEPYKAQTLGALKNWIKSAKSGDFLAFHYSGHGTFMQDTNKDEKDGRDEAICLLDDNVIDDEIKQIMVDPLPTGVKLRCLFDCCHSGTIMDLPWSARFNGFLTAFQDENKDHYIKNILMISGCRDDQTSADAWIAEHKKNEGAMTWAWLLALEQAETSQPSQPSQPSMTWYDAIQRMRFTLIDGGYDQVPQVSLSDKKLLNSRVDFLLL